MLNGERLEVLLNETKDDEWKFRRDLTISYPLESVCSYSDTGSLSKSRHCTFI